MKKIVFFWILLLSSSIYLFAQTKVPFQLSLVYPLGTNGTNTDVVNQLSVNIFAGMANGVDGVEVGGFANINKKDVNGVQVAGYLNVTGGNSKGITLAGFSNISQTAQGLQAAGFLNTTGGSSNRLIQMAGFGNVITNINGIQLAGFANFASSCNGLQLAGFTNINQHKSASQLAGFTNISCDSSDFQMSGFANISNGKTNAQLTSILNMARVANFQLGLINIADSSNTQIGLINIAKNNSQQIAVWTDELLTTNVAFKSGGRRFYAYLGLSVGADDNLRYGSNVGIGLHNYLTDRVRIDLELSSKFLIKNFDENIDNEDDIKHFNSSSLKALLVVPIGSRIELFAGPSISYRFTNSSKGAKIPSELSIWKENKVSTNHFQEIYAGATGGIAIKLN